MASHPWSPITDLPDDWEGLARPDLDEMLRLWREERQHLANPDRARQLEERLATLWAIETGVIERLYTIDRGTTASLVELGLEAIDQFSTTGRLTHNAARLIEDQRAALEFVFAYIKDDRPLTLSYIRELHQLLMRNQTHVDAVDQFGNRFQAQAQRGVWKTSPNNPTTVDGSIHEYCPPEFVQDEMDRLLAMHTKHQVLGIRPEVEAAWLHHRFTQIHPFQDGNGRVARALATMIFLKAGFVPLVVRDDDHRVRYLDALGLADAGDLKPLVDLFANIVSADLNDAITFVRTMHGRNIREIAAAAAEAARRRTVQPTWDLRVVTKRYASIATSRLVGISHQLDDAFAPLYREVVTARSSSVTFSGESSKTRGHGRWRHHINWAALHYQYTVDHRRYQQWRLLELPDAGAEDGRWCIVVSFHHKESRSDVMAVVVLLAFTGDSISVKGGDDRWTTLGSDAEFTYSGSYPQDDRFLAWLDAALTHALEAWQARI